MAFLGGVFENREFINYIIVCRKLPMLLLLSYSLNVYCPKQRTNKYVTAASGCVFQCLCIFSLLFTIVSPRNNGLSKHWSDQTTFLLRPHHNDATGSYYCNIGSFSAANYFEKKRLIFSRPPVDIVLRNPAYNVFN